MRSSGGLGINSLVQQLWNKYEPIGNDPTCGGLLGSRCDGVNEIGYKANFSLPYSSNFGVARIDHDFGSKFHFNASYRYYTLHLTTNSQIDVGGFFTGDTLGTPASQFQPPAAALVLRGWSDDKCHFKHHERPAFQLSAELLGVERRWRYASIFPARHRCGWRRA